MEELIKNKTTMKTNETDLMLTIAYDNGLQWVETTTASNGYPQNLKVAIIGMDTWDEAVRIANEHGLDIEIIESRDGWQLWHRCNNTAYHPMHIDSKDYGDDYNHYDGGDADWYFENEVKPFASECESIYDLEKFVDMHMEVMNEITDAREDQWVITRCGEYYDTIDKELMRWSYDTHNYEIALINHQDFDDDDEEE